MMTVKQRATIRTALRLLAAVFITLLFLFPIYWLFMISFKTPEEIYSFPPKWYPGQIHFDNYAVLFRDGDAVTVWNSLVVAGVSTLIAMFLGTICAYSLARFRTGGVHLANWIISQRMIPPIAVVFPIFLLFVWLHLVDTYVGVILLYTAFNLPYVIWMMRGYILDIPKALEESALVDGCTRWQVIWKVVFPMCRAGLFATAIFTFVFAWNDFLFALVLTRTEATTIRCRLPITSAASRTSGPRFPRCRYSARCRFSLRSRSCSGIWCGASRSAPSRDETVIE